MSQQYVINMLVYFNYHFLFQVAGGRLELSNLLVSLLPVVLKVPLQDYDPLYGMVKTFLFISK